VQYGKETTHGTAVAADTVLAMNAILPESDRDVHIPNIAIGNRTTRLLDSAVTRRVVADGITLEDQDGAYFEVFPLLFSMGLIGSITATEQSTGQGDYLWTFAAPQTPGETVDSITLEVGEIGGGYEIAYCLAKSIRISGDVATGEVHVSAELFGDEVLQTTLTTSQTLPSTVELCVAKLARIYIDATWAGLGGSELAGALLNFDITINGGVHPKFFGSAARQFDSHDQGEISGTATFTFERISGVVTEEAKYRPASGYAAAARFVRLTITGTQIGTGDSQTLQIDMAGAWTAWQSIAGDQDGNTYDVATLTFGYDRTGTQSLSINVTTTISAI
jgi:hypothetical protein